jgi:hypothetical protein
MTTEAGTGGGNASTGSASSSSANDTTEITPTKKAMSDLLIHVDDFVLT